MSHLIIKNAVDEPSKGNKAKKVGDFEFRAIWADCAGDLYFYYLDMVGLIMKLTIQSDRELTYNELSACCTAFKLSIKAKLPREGKGFAKGCDVKVKRYKDTGNYIVGVV